MYRHASFNPQTDTRLGEVAAKYAMQTFIKADVLIDM